MFFLISFWNRMVQILTVSPTLPIPVHAAKQQWVTPWWGSQAQREQMGLRKHLGIGFHIVKPPCAKPDCRTETGRLQGIGNRTTTMHGCLQEQPWYGLKQLNRTHVSSHMLLKQAKMLLFVTCLLIKYTNSALKQCFWYIFRWKMYGRHFPPAQMKTVASILIFSPCTLGNRCVKRNHF